MSSANRIVRIHAPFVSENEIEKVNNVFKITSENRTILTKYLTFADEKDAWY